MRKGTRAATSADDAACGATEERNEALDLRVLARECRELPDGFLELESRTVEDPVRLADPADLFRGVAVALESFRVDPLRLGHVTRREHVGGQVTREPAVHAAEAVGADAAELVHLRESAEGGVVLDQDVTRE